MAKRSQKETWESFFKRIVHEMSEDDGFRVEFAYAMAKHIHRHQVREGELDPETGKPVRYFEHVRRSNLVLMDVVGCYEPVMIIAVLFHDTIEDGRGRMCRKRIKLLFGDQAAEIVHLVTKYPDTKHRYIENLAYEADWRPLMVKACDRYDNVRTLGLLKPEKIRKQLDETKEKYYPLLDRLVKIVPEKYAAGTRKLRRLIHRAVRDQERALAARPRPTT